MTATLIIIGRVLLGFYFIQAGVRNFMKVPMHTEILTKKNLPFPREGLIVALLVQVLGGLSVALGIYPAIGAIALIVFTVAANVLYHDFWNYTGAERVTHWNSVAANIGMVGAFLLVIAIS
jgi:putative oxidoreductase